MKPDTEQAIERLRQSRDLLNQWESLSVNVSSKADLARSDELRRVINEQIRWVAIQTAKAGCLKRVTIAPPPAVGGLVLREQNPFDLIFNAPYGLSVHSIIVDIIDQTIGVMQTDWDIDDQTDSDATIMEASVSGFVFVAMPMSNDDGLLEDVLDSVKEVCKECSLEARRVDDDQTNEKITDQILDGINRAEYVVADLTNSRPNVYFEAGYALAKGKVPVFIARKGTSLEFDLKDYPVLFFENMRDLKTQLKTRLLTITANRQAKH